LPAAYEDNPYLEVVRPIPNPSPLEGKIVESPFFDATFHTERQHEFLPVVITPESEYDNVLRYAHEDKPWPDYFKPMFMAFWQRHVKQVNEQIDAQEARDDMKKNGSPGWPWNMSHATKQNVLDDPDYSQVADEYWCQAGSELCFQRVWHLIPKDEKLPKAKIESGRARTIKGPPIEVLELGKRICNDFNESFYDNRFKNHSTLGINVLGGDIHHLVSRLTRIFTAAKPTLVSPKERMFFDSDGSKWDATSMCISAFECIAQLRFESFLPQYQTVAMYNRLTNLYKEVIHTYFTSISGFILRKHTGNTSGQPSTSEDNTLISAFSYFIALAHLSDKDPETIAQWYCNGDDNICCCIDPNITYDKFVCWCKENMGVVFSRDTVPGDKWALTSSSYLSHSFENIDGVWYGKPRLDKVLSILEYTKRSHMYDPVIYLGQVSAALAHLVCYPDVYYLVYADAQRFIAEFSDLSDGTVPEWDGIVGSIVPYSVMLRAQAGPYWGSTLY